MDREKVIKGLNDIGGFIAGRIGIEQARNFIRTIDDACAMLKEQDKTVNTWHHLWDAPDGSFKARCGNCGFVHFFVQGHCSQYRFCPQCGEKTVI